ncbi:MAG: XRE family transcriptional regulator [Clostridia bacterium]|nr:XRE family transcriptional regulator [Clostridia bacterium]
MDKKYNSVLRELRKKHGYLQQEIATRLNGLGIPTTKAQISRWDNGINNPSIDQFIGLCRIYGVKDVYSVFGMDDLSGLEYALNREGMEKLEEYRKLLIASGMYSPVKLEDRVVPFRRRTAPMYDIGASAGTGQFLDSDSYEMVEVPDDVPDSATFGLRVCGDSMEPTLEDGQEIWVQMQPTLENGEIGIFYLDGNAYVKEYRCTEKGVFLVSHNEKYSPIPIREYNESKIYGKVVFPR